MSKRYSETADGSEPKKRRVRKNTGAGPLEIHKDLFPDDVDLMWVSDTILGQPVHHERMKFEINAWEPVTPDMFDGRFDGMFMPKGYRGEINVAGMVLMWRPMELTLEAREEDRALARQAVQAEEASIRRGDIPGLDPNFADANSKAARANTRIVRTVEPGGEIPR